MDMLVNVDFQILMGLAETDTMISAAGVATKQPLFSFGLISDVQYADIPDGRSFLGVPRELLPLLKIQTLDGRAYYDFSPVPEYRFVVLDTYDISALGWPQDHPKALEAMKLLREKNPNENKDSPNNLEGLERRFLKFNGAVGKEQMEWLDGVLQEATELEQKVVVCSHLPLDPGATSKEALLWNYDEVMNLMHRYNCVKVCLAGHNHTGGSSIDAHGVHHRVLEAALECPPGTDAFGSVDVYDDKISLVGTDKMESTDMHFNP
ncbi:manganese-dependent ADP-ribose/CDP-alcohol diphosphatase-like isoform X3 [Lotus japonicus]|uniref:manganese-dependent ADP-ribose/CDP-alcohol diphosphatase-like isoform X3 n=1 Tax=Lotus japonicus TaxID=34305 RepID=UPI0025873A78|nr:manganese-dependent ADP-ribose/CDP-alcohol diphosphatase-like isoform X3 [Lotus japonicus]